MTARTALNNAFQFVLTAVFQAIMHFGPQPVYINWGETRTIPAILEYRHYFQNQKEYQEKEYLRQHFDLGILLYEASNHEANIYQGELTRYTITGTVTGDMELVARNHNLDAYHAKAAIRLWLIFTNRRDIFHRLAQVSVAQINHLKDEEVDELYHLVNNRQCSLCPSDDTSSEHSDEVYFPPTPEDEPLFLQHPPAAPTNPPQPPPEWLNHPTSIIVIDEEEVLEQFDPYHADGEHSPPTHTESLDFIHYDPIRDLSDDDSDDNNFPPVEDYFDF